jgi:hypothetical protein
VGALASATYALHAQTHTANQDMLQQEPHFPAQSSPIEPAELQELRRSCTTTTAHLIKYFGWPASPTAADYNPQDLNNGFERWWSLNSDLYSQTILEFYNTPVWRSRAKKFFIKSCSNEVDFFVKMIIRFAYDNFDDIIDAFDGDIDYVSIPNFLRITIYHATGDQFDRDRPIHHKLSALLVAAISEWDPVNIIKERISSNIPIARALAPPESDDMSGPHAPSPSSSRTLVDIENSNRRKAPVATPLYDPSNQDLQEYTLVSRAARRNTRVKPQETPMKQRQAKTQPHTVHQWGSVNVILKRPTRRAATLVRAKDFVPLRPRITAPPVVGTSYKSHDASGRDQDFPQPQRPANQICKPDRVASSIHEDGAMPIRGPVHIATATACFMIFFFLFAAICTTKTC